MRFTRIFIAAVCAVIAAAQDGPNAFDLPSTGTLNPKPGQPLPLEWHNVQGATVTLRLRSGDRSDLDEGDIIEANIPNTGKYTWNVPDDIPNGGSYAIEIINDENPDEVNFTGQFPIQNANNVGGTTSASEEAATTTGSSSEASTATDSTASETSDASSTQTQSSESTSATETSASGSASRPAATTTEAGNSSVPSDNAAPILAAGGSLAAVAAAFVLAL